MLPQTKWLTGTRLTTLVGLLPCCVSKNDIFRCLISSILLTDNSYSVEFSCGRWGPQLRSESSAPQQLNCIARTIHNVLDNTPFTRYNRLSNRLYNRFDNRLYRVNKHPTGCHTGFTTGFTTVLNKQPLFVQPVVKPSCTTGLTTGCIHDTAGCQTGCQTGLTTG